MSTSLNKIEIVDYYDNCQIDYELVWHLKTKMCMHYGYWDNTTPNLRAALSNMNVKVSELAQITKHDYVLDAGCGVGGSSIFMASNYGCKTMGISLSEKQVATCKENAKKHGMEDSCSFEAQSYLSTNFPDNTFDVVWGIESVCYAIDKLDFLKEAFRVLKPGGRLVVADFFSTDNVKTEEDKVLMQKWTDTWAIKAYANKNVFWDKMTKAGFINSSQQDKTSNVLKSIRRLYYSFYPGVLITTISQWLGFRNKIQSGNTWSTYYQYKAYKKGLWSYMFYYGEKPKN